MVRTVWLVEHRPDLTWSGGAAAVTNHQIVIEDDRATCRCYVHAQHVRRGVEGGDNFVIGGRYEDTMARTPKGWRISHRRLVVMWREGNAEVVLPGA